MNALATSRFLSGLGVTYVDINDNRQERARATIRRIVETGEFRVTAPDKREAGAYYTDDLEDAISTAAVMHGPGTDVVFRSQIVFSTF